MAIVDRSDRSRRRVVCEPRGPFVCDVAHPTTRYPACGKSAARHARRTFQVTRTRYRSLLQIDSSDENTTRTEWTG